MPGGKRKQRDSNDPDQASLKDQEGLAGESAAETQASLSTASSASAIPPSTSKSSDQQHGPVVSVVVSNTPKKPSPVGSPAGSNFPNILKLAIS